MVCLKTKTVLPNLVETRTKLVNSFGRNEMSLLVVDFYWSNLVIVLVDFEVNELDASSKKFEEVELGPTLSSN